MRARNWQFPVRYWLAFAVVACTGQHEGPATDVDAVSLPAECAACVAPFGRCLDLQGSWFCVGCATDADCVGAGSVCHKPSYSCLEGSGLPYECAVCVNENPACLSYGGVWYCAECVTDADCAAKNAGGCQAATFTCSDTVPLPVACTRDTDCFNHNGAAFDLACDVTRGHCWDRLGRCDDVSAYCRSDLGSACAVPEAVTPGDALDKRCSCAGDETCYGGLTCAARLAFGATWVCAP